jgi:secondary thiamine-phosphate synthase enzyme
VRTERLSVNTQDRFVVDVTDRVRGFVQGTKGDGLLHVFLVHATAGLALMETGAGSESDLAQAVQRLLPPDDRYAHRHGSPGHGRDHLLPAFFQPSLVLAIHDGDVVLGTWQRIVVVDPNRENNERTVVLSLMEATAPER